MTWTYSGDPSSSNRDAVRFAIGDTDSTDEQLSDAEIAYLLAEHGNVYAAAQEAVRNLLAKFARLVDKSVGDLKISYSQRLAAYRALLDRLGERQLLEHGTIYAGGVSQARKDIVEDDDDLVQANFRRDQFSDSDGEDNDECDS